MEVVQTLAFATPRFLSWSYRRAAAHANRLLHSSWSRLQIPTDPQQSQPCPLSGRLMAQAIHSKGGPEARSHLAPVGGILARSDHPAASAPWPRIVVFAGVVVDYGLGPSDSSCSSSKLPSPFERQEFII